MNVEVVFVLFFRRKPLTMPEFLLRVCRRVEDHGYQAFVVGGAIRDLLRGVVPEDWDVATDATPDNIEHIFPNSLPTGKQFGTVTVRCEGGHTVEITTFRLDAAYSDGRRPDHVRYAQHIEDDLKRRDFSINAIAYRPLSGVYVDPHNGIADIRRKRLRTVGSADERFREDALRMLRLLRFQATLGFRPDRAAVAAINPVWITHVSWERIREELSKLLQAPQVTPSLTTMYRTGIMREILPELAACERVYQGTRHRWDVLYHSIQCAAAIRPDLRLRLAALLHDVGKPGTRSEDSTGVHFYNHDARGAEITSALLTRLRYPKGLIHAVTCLVRHHMFQIHPHSSDKAIRRFLSKVGQETAFSLLELRKADIMAMHSRASQAWHYVERLHQRLEEMVRDDQIFTVANLAVDGHDIMTHLALPPGPTIGQLLHHLLDTVVANPEANERSALLHLATEEYQRLCTERPQADNTAKRPKP